MLRVALSAVQAPSAAYGVEVLPPGQDQVQLVSVLGSGVAPGDLVLGLVLKECVGDGQLVEAAQLEDAASDHSRSSCQYHGVRRGPAMCQRPPRSPQGHVESFIAGHASDCPIKDMVEAVFASRRGQH